MWKINWILTNITSKRQIFIASTFNGPRLPVKWMRKQKQKQKHISTIRAETPSLHLFKLSAHHQRRVYAKDIIWRLYGCDRPFRLQCFGRFFFDRSYQQYTWENDAYLFALMTGQSELTCECEIFDKSSFPKARSDFLTTLIWMLKRSYYSIRN